MQVDFSILPFSPGSAGKREIKAWYVLKAALRLEVLPEDPVFSFNKLVQNRLAFDDIYQCRDWVAWDSSRKIMLGHCIVYTSRTLPNSKTAKFTIDVLKPYRRTGLGNAFLRLTTEAAEISGRNLLRAYSNDRCEAGASFFESIGAMIVLKSHQNRLQLKGLERGIIQRWLDLPDESAFKIAVKEWRGRIPEEYIQEIADFYQTVYDAEPQTEGSEAERYRFTPENVLLGEKKCLAGGRKRIIVYARDVHNNKLTGLTEISWSPSRPSILSQGYTAVLPDFRGKGIGKRLKAEMLERIMRELPQAELIQAGNDDSNNSILSINTELGFKHFIATTTWQATTETVKKYLALKNE
ncbi:MAG: GNAT family N-acetyltransferase [Candidatus Sabulitectum sp.]|nr:GNAT family N-acetyltransferase [Candidatus Sabulitectum sp.]